MSQTANETLSFIQSVYPDKLLLDKKQTAKILSISAMSLDRLRKEGRIHSQMVGGKVLFKIHDIARYL